MVIDKDIGKLEGRMDGVDIALKRHEDKIDKIPEQLQTMTNTLTTAMQKHTDKTHALIEQNTVRVETAERSVAKIHIDVKPLLEKKKLWGKIKKEWIVLVGAAIIIAWLPKVVFLILGLF